MNKMAKLSQLRQALQDRLKRASSAGQGTPKPPAAFLEEVAAQLAKTNDQELACDECAETLDRFVELAVAGEDVQKLYPMIHHHLEMCGECHEEYQALLRIVRDG